jgi:molecular chaperone DnaK
MGRTTIDFGIDLGTTNSEIACMDTGELVVVKNMVTGSEVTPSAVKVDAKGTVIVGQSAYNEIEYDPDNAIGEFKRWMGNADHDGFTFKKSGRRMTAAQLSAEILKALKASASSRFGGEEISAAVVTVPAMFLIPSCEDTKTAAKLAGIELSPLLQEPVAAAMAYGYRAENLNGNLLVFDLGGGTFDTTVLAAREGRLVVVGHDGDDKLGGKDYDWALVDLLIQRLAAEYRDLGVSRDGTARRPMAKLKYIAEDAKKSLSLLPSVSVEVNRLGDGLDDVDAVIQLSRGDLERATEHLTRRCISICRRLLKQARLSTDDLSAVLVVGGQTQTPYIRDMVAAELGKADFRLDPLTVVAAGAALFASTQRIPSRSTRQASGGSVELKLAYSPVSTELDADVSIAVQSVAPGATLTIIRSDGGWSSGAIAVPANGKIHTTVVLRARKANAFEVQLRDASGALVRTNETRFSITHGLAVAQATTSRAFGVALEQNDTQVIIPNGSPLPAKGVQKFVTAHEVVAGNRKSTLKIYVLEGDNRRADRNIKVGEIILYGDEIRRSLPAGETVEITYRLDESKTLSAEAVFPSLREARQMVYRPERPELHAADIELEVRKEKERIAEIERAAPEKLGSQIGRQIVLVEREKEAASEDHDARQKAAQQLIELKQAVDALECSSEWELLLVELDGYRDGTKRIEAYGKDDQRRDYADTLKAADAAVANHDLALLRKSVQRLRDIYWTVSLSQDDFWKAQFAQLWAEAEFVDPLKAERLKEEGMRALKRDDVSSLRTIVWDLYRLLPTWQQRKLDMRFGDAGLRKARGQGE